MKAAPSTTRNMLAPGPFTKSGRLKTQRCGIQPRRISEVPMRRTLVTSNSSKYSQCDDAKCRRRPAPAKWHATMAAASGKSMAPNEHNTNGTRPYMPESDAPAVYKRRCIRAFMATQDACSQGLESGPRSTAAPMARPRRGSWKASCSNQHAVAATTRHLGETACNVQFGDNA